MDILPAILAANLRQGAAPKLGRLDGTMKAPLSGDVLSHLIGLVYDCALEPERWPDTLSCLRNALDFANASLSLVALPSGEVLLDNMSSADPIWIERAPQSRKEVLEIWGGEEKVQSYPLGEPLVLSRLRPRSEWENSRYFQNWARPHGIHDILAIGLARDATSLGSLAFGRHDSAGEIGDLEVEAARLLIPHLRRSAAISRLLDVKSVVAATFETALDALAVAIVLTDAELRIVHANVAGRDMLACRDPIRSENGRLAVRSTAAGAALGVAVRRAGENDAAIGRRGFGIPAPRADGAPCVLHVLPLSQGDLRPGLAPSAVAAIFVAPAVSPPPPPHEAMAALFDLTPAESRVFEQIAAGNTLAETAEALGIEVTTTKTHLARLFDKTGTHRQAHLVRLGATLALPLGG
jgi:DNA-binding CsgD family transcriptional regulator/PAS domain-containing protein